MLERLFNWQLLKDKYVCIFVVIYLLVAYLTIFNHLGSNPIREFDETRMGISAYEMLQDKNPIVVSFLGEPDLWITKPPLVFCIQALFILKEKYFWIGLLIFVVFFGGFLVTREIMASGYLKALWQNDVFGRYTQTLEKSSSSPLFYFSRFYKHTFKYLFIYVPFAFLINVFSKEKRVRDLNYFAFGIFTFIFLALAFSKTKLDWHTYHAVSMLCIIIALTIDFFRSIFTLQTSKAQKICCYTFIFIVFFAAPLSDNILSFKGSFSISAKKDGTPYPYPSYIRLLKIHKQDIIDKKIDNLYFLQKEWPLNSYCYYLTLKDKEADVHYLNHTDLNNLPQNIYAVTVNNKKSREVLDKYDWEEVCYFGDDDKKA